MFFNSFFLLCKKSWQINIAKKNKYLNINVGKKMLLSQYSPDGYITKILPSIHCPSCKPQAFPKTRNFETTNAFTRMSWSIVVKEKNNIKKTNYIPQKKILHELPYIRMKKAFAPKKSFAPPNIFALKREVRTVAKWKSKKKTWVESHRMVLHIQLQLVNNYICPCILL